MRAVSGILAALVLGLGSAWLAVRGGMASGQIENGPWRTSLVAGSADADLYTRARIAIGGLLALAPSETIYFTASTDADGEPLVAGCDYRVEGEELAARWWSLTAYGADHFLIPNDAGRYSFSQTTLTREPRGPWAMRVSPESQPGDWLPSGRSGEAHAFSITLRLYNPELSVYAAPAATPLPRIAKERCR